MNIRPILSAMLRNKTGPLLIAMQVAITLAIVANSAFIINERIEKMNRPTGMDDANLVFATSYGFGAGYDHKATLQEDLEALRAMPGVVSAAYMNRPPITGGGSASSWANNPEYENAENAAYFRVDENGAQTLGLELVQGRWFEKQDVFDEVPGAEPNGLAIITKSLAEKLFPGEPAAGKIMYTGLGEPVRIVGVVKHMQGAWPNWERFELNALFPMIEASPNLGYVIRVEPGMADRMVPQIEEKLQSINRSRVITTVRTLHEYMKRSYNNDASMVKLLSAVSILLVAVTAFGIVGLAAFNVNQRRKQIGTRRALGATRQDILRHFTTEALLITLIGGVLGTILAFAMSFWLGTQFSVPKMDWWYVPPVFGALLVIGVVAVLGPARRASLISPALATRSV